MRILSTLVRLLAEFGKSSKARRCPACKKEIQDLRCQYCRRDYDQAARLSLFLSIALTLAVLTLGWVILCYGLLEMPTWFISSGVRDGVLRIASALH